MFKDDRARVGRIRGLAGGNTPGRKLGAAGRGAHRRRARRAGRGRKGGGPITAPEDEVKGEVRKQAEQLSSEGIETTVEMRTIVLGGQGGPISEIAREAGADLIVVGTRGHSAAAGVLLGSVTQRLLRRAPCPVLVVPPGDRS